MNRSVVANNLPALNVTVEAGEAEDNLSSHIKFYEISIDNIIGGKYEILCLR